LHGRFWNEEIDAAYGLTSNVATNYKIGNKNAEDA
jgi:hypothetical protein